MTQKPTNQETELRKIVRDSILADPNDFISITGDMGIYDIESRIVAKLQPLLASQRKALLLEIEEKLDDDTRTHYDFQGKDYGFECVPVESVCQVLKSMGEQYDGFE